ncbi:hypothetical protein ACI1US_01138 [Leucobacter sp. BZR 635]
MGKRNGMRRGYAKVLATLGVLTIGITGVLGSAPAEALLPTAVEPEAEVVEEAPEVQGLSAPDAAAAAAAAPLAAAAAAPASCQVDTVYALGKTRFDRDGDDYKWEILAINHSGSYASVESLASLGKSRIDGLGMVPGGTAAVYAKGSKLSKGATPTLYMWDFGTKRQTTLSGVTKLAEAAPKGIQAGAVHPYNGLYYYGYPTVSNNVMTWHIYAYDVANTRAIGKVGTVPLLPGYGGLTGDFAFDPQGNLYLVNDAGSRDTSMVQVPAKDVAAVASNAVWNHSGRGAAGVTSPSGAAWLASNDAAPLGMVEEDGRYTILSARALENGAPAPAKTWTTEVLHVSDLANCAPKDSGFEIQTNLTSRINIADQFTVSASGAVPATTAGSANGAQPGIVRNVSPEPGKPVAVKVEFKRQGHTSEYSAELACVVKETNAPIPTTKSGEGEFTFTYPTAPGGRAPAVHCDLTVGAPATIQVTKELPAGRAWATDQFSVAMKENGKPVIAAGATALSEGTGTRVNAGTGTSGKIRAKAGATYSLSESAPASVNTAHYTSTITCVDPTGIQQNLPSGQPLPVGSPFDLKTTEGAQVSCVITNTSTGAASSGGFTCEAGAIYGMVNVNGRAESYIAKISTELFAAGTRDNHYRGEIISSNLHQTQSGTLANSMNVNSLAITQGGAKSLFVGQANFVRNGSFELYELDNAKASGKPVRKASFSFPTGILDHGSGSAVRGGVNPADGMYWASATSYRADGSYRHHFWAYDTLTDVNYGYVGFLTSQGGASAGTMYGNNGDLVFDQDGNMLFLSASSLDTDMTRLSGMNKGLAVVNGRTTVTDLSPAKYGIKRASLMKPTQLPASNGITFDNDGYLWTSLSDGQRGSLNRVDPNTGTLVDNLQTWNQDPQRPSQGWYSAGGVVKLKAPNGQYTQHAYITDLADCNDPGGLQVLKNIGDRASAGDQFQLEVFRSSFPAGAERAQTSGDATGLQADAIAGPIVGIPGQAYTVRETMTGGKSLAPYGTTLACVDVANGNAPVETQMLSQGEGSFIFPGLGAAPNAPLPNVECTFTNSPKATLSVDKSLTGTRVATNDQFTVQILAGGGVVKDATTKGSGKTVTKGSGATGAVPVNPETEYVITEAGAAGTNLANYPGATITCLDPTGHHQGLPVDQPLDPAGFAITPAPMSKISCTITNTPGEAELATKKTLLTVTGVDGSEVEATEDTKVSPGDVLKYQIATTNRGVIAGSTKLSEIVPEGTTYTGKNEGWSCSTQSKRAASADSAAGQVCLREVKNLAPGATDTATFTVTVGDAKALLNDGDPLNEIHNLVVSSDGVCEPGDCEVVTPLQPNWTVAKTAAVDGKDGAAEIVRSGQKITYTLTATSKLGEIRDVVLTDDLSGVLETADFVKGSVTWEFMGRTQKLDDSVLTGTTLVSPAVTLHGGDVAKLSYSVTVKAGKPLQTITNSVTGAGSAEPDQCVTGKPETSVDACVTTHRTGAAITVQKLNENGTALPGAEFVVKSNDGGGAERPGKPGKELSPNLVKDPQDASKFTLADMTPGWYWLIETQSPEAAEGKQPYQLLAQPVPFQVRGNGDIVLTPVEEASAVSSEGSTIKVVNRPGFVLPNSGGLGTAAYTVIGVAILSVAMFALLRRRRAEAVVTEDD